MTKDTSSQTMGFGQLYNVICCKPDAEFMVQQTTESLAAIRFRCDTHWSRNFLLHSWKLRGVIGVLAYFAFLTLIVTNSKSPIDGPGWVALLVPLPLIICLATVGILGVGTAVLFELTGLSRPKLISDSLTPLKSEPFLCRDAVGVLKDSARARDYRNRVVAMGRELLVADAHVLYRARHLDTKEELAAKAAEDCKRVHGLSTT